MKPKIVVVGSSNTDLVVKLPRLPRPGETIIGGTFSMAAGGKGANQAVAASRAGGDVTFLAKVGNDHFGAQAVDSFKNDGLDIRFVDVVPATASGIGLIFVDQNGENCIGVASGANNELLPADVEKASELIASADVLLLQLEIPLTTVEAAVRIASKASVRVLLNPAPARQLDPNFLKQISVITPNENEVELLTGIHIEDDTSVQPQRRSCTARAFPPSLSLWEPAARISAMEMAGSLFRRSKWRQSIAQRPEMCSAARSRLRSENDYRCRMQFGLPAPLLLYL